MSKKTHTPGRGAQDVTREVYAIEHPGYSNKLRAVVADLLESDIDLKKIVNHVLSIACIFEKMERKNPLRH